LSQLHGLGYINGYALAGATAAIFKATDMTR